MCVCVCVCVCGKALKHQLTPLACKSQLFEQRIVQEKPRIFSVFALLFFFKRYPPKLIFEISFKRVPLNSTLFPNNHVVISYVAFHRSPSGVHPMSHLTYVCIHLCYRHISLLISSINLGKIWEKRLIYGTILSARCSQNFKVWNNLQPCSRQRWDSPCLIMYSLLWIRFDDELKSNNFWQEMNNPEENINFSKLI